VKKVIITVTNDLEVDQRMHKTSLTLSKNGYDVLLLGRKLSYSKPLNRSYATKRMRLLFNKGFLFYACYNFRLFLFLTFHKWDIVLSCDLDSLPGAWFAQKIRRKTLVYDSHELFTELPELQNRPHIKNIWLKIEKFFLKRVKYSYTVCQSIADYYNNKYGINMDVIRNVPSNYSTTEDCNIPIIPEPFIIYQGALNTGRGIEKLIDAMQYIPGYNLVIAGHGTIKEDLIKTANLSNCSDRIHFTGRLDFSCLKALTKKAKLGFSLEEDLGLNYRFALPNKLFDYLQAGIPVLVSDLPEMHNIIEQSKCGECIAPDADSKTLAKHIRKILEDSNLYEDLKANSQKAGTQYTWEIESNKQLEIFRSITELSKINI
jgi:glycosyltransferase involved in cell wall biosynthesis